MSISQNLKDHFEEVNEKIIVKAPYIEAFLNKEYFENGIAEQYADTVSCFGFFPFIIYKEIDNNKDILIKSLELSTRIETKPSVIENVKKDDDSDPIVVMKYYKGDIFVNDINVIMTVENVAPFYKLLTAGKISTSIAYDRLLNIVMDNASLNKFNYGVSAVILELMLSEICRDKKDITQKFRFTLNKNPNTPLDDYQAINITRIPQFESVFTGLSFQDFNTAATLAVNRAHSGLKDNISPVEKTIKF